MYECQKSGLEFCKTAPYIFRAEQLICATPEQIFEVFEDPQAWTQWVPPIEHVEWTSPKPFARGTTRTVRMKGGLILEEEFIRWEPSKRMAFYFARISKAYFEAVVEDYRVTDLGNGACQIVWLFCLQPRGIMKFFFALARPFLAGNNRKVLGRLKEYVERRYAAQ